MDVDGVMSDGKIIVRDDGIENKHFNVKDGLAVKLGRDNGLHFGVISGRNTEAVRIRCEKLGIDEVHLGKHGNKPQILEEIMKRNDLTRQQCCFIGDDLIDAGAMSVAGASFAPADASAEIRKIADIVTKKKGGEGVIREVVEIILKAGDKYAQALTAYL